MSDATILEFQQAASKTYSNEALCRVPKREWHKIKDLCDKAIKFDDKNFKGRRSSVCSILLVGAVVL